MKIGLESHPVAVSGSYAESLYELLSRHAPEHEYLLDCNNRDDLDVYHDSGTAPWHGRRGRVPHVVTVRNLGCLRHPELFSRRERRAVLDPYRAAVRGAARLIVPHGGAGRELARLLGIGPERIEVFLPLTVCPPAAEPDAPALDAVRRKYALPDEFLLTVGPPEPRRHLPELLAAMADAGCSRACVVCGRRTPYAERLLARLRTLRAVSRVEFLYEPEPADLPALFRLAHGFVYLPDASAEAPAAPIVEALRAGLPSLLSDLPLHREAADDAAAYVRPETHDELCGGWTATPDSAVRCTGAVCAAPRRFRKRPSCGGSSRSIRRCDPARTAHLPCGACRFSGRTALCREALRQRAVIRSGQADPCWKTAKKPPEKFGESKSLRYLCVRKRKST